MSTVYAGQPGVTAATRLEANGINVTPDSERLIDGVIMIGGTVYGVFVADNFVGPFEGFLITLGVPIAAWCGVFLGDLLWRRRDYAEAELYDRRGRYGDVRVLPVLTLAVATTIGWGLVINTTGTSWLKWQGYFLDLFGLGGKTGSWAYANLGVLVAFVIGFIVTLVADRRRITGQEAASAPAAVPAATMR